MDSSSKVSRSRNVSRIGRWAALVFGYAALCGCYLLESAQGQLALLSKRRPIERVIAEPETPPALRARLAQVKSLRDFASRELGLPDNGSYRSYADLGRPYVVWTVVAAPEFSVDATQWCFPLVGCVAYRGYFVERKARAFAARLKNRGFDVSVGGVAAYSTLGHFNDPILNTMMGWSDIDLAAIIFHELTHQVIYLPNDAPFNEALATTVEEEGVRRWLSAQGRDGDLARHLEDQAHYLAVIDLMRRARAELKRRYASGGDADRLRADKAATFAELRRAYDRLRSPWMGPAPFEAWFDAGLNNAQLASIATYYDCVPGFERELAAVQGNLTAFFHRVRQLATLDPATRDTVLCANTRPMR